MAASATPLPTSSADPLAGLSSYDLQFLPTHLTDAGRVVDLFKLLLLQRGDDSNAWFAAKPDVAAYIEDVDRARALAVQQADCAKVIALGLIVNSVRSITQLSAPMIEALVSRGLLSLQQAISMCIAAEPSRHISGMARLLAKIGPPERGRYLQGILTTMAVPVTQKSMIGHNRGASRIPLSVGEHVAVISQLAALANLSESELEAIERSVWLVAEPFAGVEAAVAVADVITGASHAQLVARAWSTATGLGVFRGQPEAEALVAACAARHGDRHYLTDAVDLALSVLDSSEERLKFNDWAPHQQDPGFGRSRLMRLQLFTEPLKTLAPVLGPEQMICIVRELVRRWDVPARFGLITLLPRVAQLGLLHEADRVFGQLDDVAVMAVGALLGAGVRVGGLHAEDILPSLAGLAEMEPRTMCMLALLPDLPPERRLAEIENLLRDVEDLGPRSSFRRDVLAVLSPSIRQLPGSLRDALIRRAREPGELTRTDEEAAILLDPLVDVWPAELLQQKLDDTRRIGLRSSEAVAAHRGIRRHEAALREPQLSPDAATAALGFAAELGDADKAAALVLLAPFLDAASRREAGVIAAGIADAHLRLEPEVRLAGLEPSLGSGRLVNAFQLLAQVTGGLGRLKQTIDLAAGLIEPGHAPAVRATLAAVAQDLPNDDLVVLCPVAARAGEAGYYDEIDQAIARLAIWFGVDGTPAERSSTEPAPVTLDTAAAGARLVGEFSRRGDWATVRSLLAVLHTAAGDNEETIAAAETQIVTSAATGSAGDRLSLLADLVRSAPSRPRRLRALAAALGAALDMPHSNLAATLASHPDLAPGPVHEPDPDLAAAISAVIDLRLARGDLAAAAAAMTGLVTDGAPYRMAAGRLASHAASSIARYLDGENRPSVQAGEAAIGGYLDFVAAHPEDYALQEAAGNLLRQRVGTAAAAGREIRPSWLSRLDSLADADEPGEVLLHQLALEATCDAAVAAARSGQPGRSVELFRLAYGRWQRHRELEAGTRYFTDTTRSAASILQAAGKRKAAAHISELAVAVGSPGL